jgi:prepilin-type processing-associated H-X9-DG protein
MLVEVHRNSAVVWTKPDDLVIDAADPLKALAGQPSGGFSAAFADGSVRFVSQNVDLKMLWNLLRMNDGNPVGEF